MLNGHRLRRTHRWFALFAGLQMSIWILSGVYMVLMDIDFIHGDTLTATPNIVTLKPVSYPITTLLQHYPDANKIHLTQRQGQAFYQFSSQSQLIILNADTGLPLAPLTEQQAKHIAVSAYTGNGTVSSALLFEQDAPSELNPKWLPVWQINFADIKQSSLYVSADTGEIVTKRHVYWRLFDVMWMLHIMDYDTRDNIHNNLLTLMASLSLLTALFGTMLLWFRLSHNKKVTR